MKILSAAVSAATSDYARELRARAAVKQAQEARKAEVSADAARVRASPRFETSENRKSQARARLQQVREWLKIVRKLFAQDPKGMARALAQAFKDLKSAVQAFKDAGGQEMGTTADVVGGVLASSSSQSAGEPPTDKALGEEAGGAHETPSEPALPPRADSDGADEAARSAIEGRSLYDQVVGQVRKELGEDGLGFVREVRGLVEDIRKLLETARGQATIRRPDKDTSKALEDADKALKALHDGMDDMEAEIRRDAPTAGLRLSIAA